ncbi:MAG: DUF551 domain-containing protein [Dehalococcoidia bacterium]
MSTDLLARLEALAKKWDQHDATYNKGWRDGHAYELRVCLADERKRRATPIVDRSSEISWKDDDDDPDSRIVHGEPGDGWISVKDRLPGDGERVLATDHGHVYTATLDTDGVFSDWWCDSDDETHPTHWRPLPEPPKETP